MLTQSDEMTETMARFVQQENPGRHALELVMTAAWAEEQAGVLSHLVETVRTAAELRAAVKVVAAKMQGRAELIRFEAGR